jgi:hypothetical protein
MKFHLREFLEFKKQREFKNKLINTNPPEPAKIFRTIHKSSVNLFGEQKLFLGHITFISIVNEPKNNLF